MSVNEHKQFKERLTIWLLYQILLVPPLWYLQKNFRKLILLELDSQKIAEQTCFQPHASYQFDTIQSALFCALCELLHEVLWQFKFASTINKMHCKQLFLEVSLVRIHCYGLACSHSHILKGQFWREMSPNEALTIRKSCKANQEATKMIQHHKVIP